MLKFLFFEFFHHLFKDVKAINCKNTRKQKHLERESSGRNKPLLVTELLNSDPMADLPIDGRIEQRNSKAAVKENPLVLNRPGV